MAEKKGEDIFNVSHDSTRLDLIMHLRYTKENRSHPLPSSITEANIDCLGSTLSDWGLTWNGMHKTYSF